MRGVGSHSLKLRNRSAARWKKSGKDTKCGKGKGAGISFQILRTYEGGDASYNNISLCVRWSWVIDFAEPTLALE
jgi:hypothetical protein